MGVFAGAVCSVDQTRIVARPGGAGDQGLAYEMTVAVVQDVYGRHAKRDTWLSLAG